jgi:hypothetical protein
MTRTISPMLRLDRTRRELDLSQYRLRRAAEDDCSEVAREPFMLYEDGVLKVVYLELGDHPEDGPQLDRIFHAVQRVKFQKTSRTAGLVTTSRTFGFLPRVTLRRDFCTASSLAREQPVEHAIVASGAELVGRWYRAVNPELYEHHREITTEKMLPDYRLEDEIFTSGIINENNPLKYHFDGGNLRNVWSGMLVFRDGIEGGMLAMPEYDLAVALKHKSLFLFDGQGILHGVTPMRLLHPNAKRYSLVYYSMQGIWNCEPLGSELSRIRRKRVEREQRRAATPPKGATS